MARIFISYRRDDSAAMAGRIFDHLQNYFGREAIFIDVDTIPYGVDFRQYLNDSVSQCDVLLAVIGERWLDTYAMGKRKVDNPTDFVRIEVEVALRRNIPVIPVLIGQISMPTADELPESLVDLTYRNAIRVDVGRDFHTHVERLVRGLEHLLSGLPGSFTPAIDKNESLHVTDEIRELISVFKRQKRSPNFGEMPDNWSDDGSFRSRICKFSPEEFGRLASMILHADNHLSTPSILKRQVFGFLQEPSLNFAIQMLRYSFNMEVPGIYFGCYPSFVYEIMIENVLLTQESETAVTQALTSYFQRISRAGHEFYLFQGRSGIPKQVCAAIWNALGKQSQGDVMVEFEQEVAYKVLDYVKTSGLPPDSIRSYVESQVYPKYIS